MNKPQLDQKPTKKGIKQVETCKRLVTIRKVKGREIGNQGPLDYKGIKAEGKIIEELQLESEWELTGNPIKKLQ
jgi:hypothetical protein